MAMKIVYEHSRTAEVVDESFDTLFDWANHKSLRGFTALHFAAFHGNIEMIEYLVTQL